MAGFSEKRLVEDFVAQELERLGWTFVPPHDLPRADLQEVLILEELEAAIHRLNEDLHLTPDELRRALTRLQLLGSGVEGHKRTLEYLKQGIPIKRDKTHEVIRVRLVDPDHPERNRLIFTRQLPFEGAEPIRPDILLFVNGIPLVDIECKNPARPGVSWEDAYKQIKRYEQSVPELFRFVQMGVAVEREARYFPIVPWQEEVHTYTWRTARKEEDPLRPIFDLLRPARLLDFFQHFLYFREERGAYTKVMARYMQVRATNRIVRRVLVNMGHPLPPLLAGEEREDEGRHRGLIWHWQGSGKTLTMIFASQKLARLLGNPTIFFVVDRVDLQDQLEREFSALDVERKARVIPSIADLQRVLRTDGYRGKRGIFITLIHKFRYGDFQRFRREMEAAAGEGPSFRTRWDIVLFVDEGHRTQYGVLGAEMYDLFRAGFAFGFTGTPLAVQGRDTFRVFAYPDQGELYLDKYFVSDSLQDGFTVPIVYQPRLERDVHLRRDLLEAFLDVELDELPEPHKERVEDALARRLDMIRVFLENEQRIDRVARDIAEHFQSQVNEVYKGMVVTVSRRACVLFKQALDRYLPPEWTEVVMTFSVEDDPALQAFREEWFRRNPGADFREAVSNLLHRYREEPDPRILIVTDMLLTGFDAPILQTLYLVKPLKGHRLLQTVARVNRPYRGVKKAGLVVDYVGVLRHLKRAFAMYREEDIRRVLQEYGTLEKDFQAVLEELLEFFEGLALRFERRALLQAFERVTREEGREDWFRERYQTLRQLFELLPPDTLKREAWEAYKWLTAVYVYYRKMTLQAGPDRLTVDRYFRKTLRMIHRATEIQELDRSLPEVRFDERYFQALEHADLSLEEKAASALFALNRFVLVDKNPDPVFQSLADRVERLVEAWKQHTRDYRKLYAETLAILKDARKLRERQKALGFSSAAFALLLFLEEHLGSQRDWTRDVKELWETLQPWITPGWTTQPALRKRVERAVRVFCRRVKREMGLTLGEMNDLHDALMERLMQYEA